MCQNLEEFEEHHKLIFDPIKSLCPTCQFNQNCSFLAQQDQQAEILIVGHPRLRRQRPGFSSLGNRRVFATVIDESPSIEAGPRFVSPADFTHFGGMTSQFRADLSAFRGKLMTLLQEHPGAGDTRRPDGRRFDRRQ